MGNEPRLGSKIFYKIGEVSQIAEASGLCVAILGVRIPVSQAQKKSWESTALCQARSRNGAGDQADAL